MQLDSDQTVSGKTGAIQSSACAARNASADLVDAICSFAASMNSRPVAGLAIAHLKYVEVHIMALYNEKWN